MNLNKAPDPDLWISCLELARLLIDKDVDFCLDHRYIKPCFLVLGLDFYHFNRSSSFFCPGSLEIYIY